MENVVGQAVVGADLYGRDAELKDLWDGFAGGEHIHMLAPRRVGKTSLMLDLLADPVLYHVQLFFKGIYAKAGGDTNALSGADLDAVFADALTGSHGTAHLDHYGTRLETTLDAESYEIAQEILALSSDARGAAMSEIRTLAEGRERLVRSVLNELEFDGYVYERDERLLFCSNLLRTWWRKHRVGTQW